ncbi:MAG: sulfite exporter TauE/SafE family protein [SAR324 cluster bacterium]|nr:sulfite exporter TauE/SafE family protein [SAR324 cluster bacterium]MCZ6532942.1 sulfite exporter TauE/SafE family protein [SAR324 cluster bacterium]MCZ6558732.1 sulfite exporter TauE/SafE family protein [SAR324 cluster bacterium]MCZ6626838.1 sulfite exporter TauE/SafE family protein [SAR324 cluster bacterium]MCZ6730307.1 sulfite exporter TauE/SafE family protein [SAR324 cluster bacterium]
MAAREALPDLWPWWVWPIALFFLTAALGVLAAMAGIGGGVLFVPIVSALMPSLHIDFVRGAGLMVALTGALSAGPTLIRQNLAHLRLAMPLALVASFAAIFGARLGLAMPAETVQLLLGLVILGMFALMLYFRPATARQTGGGDRIARFFKLEGVYFDAAQGQSLPWAPRHMAVGLLLFCGVGFMAGMFGLGAGWANVPVLTLVMGVPLKIAVGTSYFLLAIADTSAAWIYLNQGAVIPLIATPSALGIMLGARLGARLLVRARPGVIRWVVLGVLLLAGARSFLKGIGI